MRRLDAVTRTVAAPPRRRRRWRLALAVLGLCALLIGLGFLAIVFWSSDGVLGLWQRWRSYQGRVDPLTGLFNRRYMIRHIENLRQARHSDTEPIAALMVDIDHFKSVNDTYGHDVGDKVLQAVANQMRGRLRPGDVLSRHGGEEFLVVLPAADRALASSVAERLRQSIADMSIPLPNGATPLRVTVSIGLTLDLGKALSVDDVIKRADEALYQAKREGRNRVVVVDSVPAAAA